VVHRAQEVLDELESDGRVPLKKTGHRKKEPPPAQIPMFGQKSAVQEELEKLEIDSMTPLEALTRLYELQRKAREK
jgi:DNA mismatch repair protein MutS